MAKMEVGPLGEQVLVESAEKEIGAAGDCMAEGFPDGRKEAGEEGGAINGSLTSGG